MEEGRQQFNKEMVAIMPDVKLGKFSKFFSTIIVSFSFKVKKLLISQR